MQLGSLVEFMRSCSAEVSLCLGASAGNSAGDKLNLTHPHPLILTANAFISKLYFVQTC